MVGALKDASVAMKEQHAKLDIDEIEDLQDDLEDMTYMSEEINELMGRSYGYAGLASVGPFNASDPYRFCVCLCACASPPQCP